MVNGSAKHDMMYKTNLLAILNCIRQFGPIKRQDIQKRTGQSWGTISSISAHLLSKGVLTEEKDSYKGTGRTPYLLDINSTDNLVIGLDINIDGLDVVVIDLKHRVLFEKSQAITTTDRNSIMNQVRALIANILSTDSFTSNRFIGIGIAMQGSIDAKGGISRYAPFFRDWANVPLKEILEQEFGIPVSILHDPSCVALAEHWVGHAQSVDNFLLVRVSNGIGVGVFIDGKTYSGHEGVAGEIGHMTVQVGGVPCYCGGEGCLESYSSAQGIIKSAMRCGIVDGETKMEDLVAKARSGEEPYLTLFDDAGKYLGVALSNVVNLLNPEMIVLCGSMMDYYDLLKQKMDDVLSYNKWDYATVKIEISQLEHGAAIGAATYIVKMVLSGQIEIT